MAQQHEVVVVGAGIAGASVAFRLAPHRQVCVIEAESQPGMHATGRSAAMFMESYGAPGVRALTRASRAFYESPPPGFAEVPLLQPRGALYLATPEQAGQIEPMRAALAGDGAVVEPLSAEQVLAQVPVLRPQRVHGGLLERDAQDIDVHALHQGFLRGLRGAGGTLRTDSRLQSARHDGRRWTLTLADGDICQAEVLVNAAGAWADEVARACGIRPVGLVPKRRSAFTFRAPAGVDPSAWPALADIEEQFYFKPDAGRLLGSPANADPTVPHDVVPEEIDIATGIHHIESVTTLQIRRPERVWAGLRSFVADGELVIGPDDANPAFVWLAAQGGYGIQSAAGASALAAAQVLGQPLPQALRACGVDADRQDPRRLR